MAEEPEITRPKKQKINFTENKMEEANGDEYECGLLAVEPTSIPDPLRMLFMSMEHIINIQQIAAK